MIQLSSLTPEFREHLEDKLYNERFEDARDATRDDLQPELEQEPKGDEP